MQASMKSSMSEDFSAQCTAMMIKDNVQALQLSGDMADATDLIEAASKLIQMIAFDVVMTIEGTDVVELLRISAKLEAQGVRLRKELA